MHERIQLRVQLLDPVDVRVNEFDGRNTSLAHSLCHLTQRRKNQLVQFASDVPQANAKV
jgi:hypothetical protein